MSKPTLDRLKERNSRVIARNTDIIDQNLALCIVTFVGHNHLVWPHSQQDIHLPRIEAGRYEKGYTKKRRVIKTSIVK